MGGCGLQFALFTTTCELWLTVKWWVEGYMHTLSCTWNETSVTLAGPIPSTLIESLSRDFEIFLITTSALPGSRSTVTNLVT